MLRLRDNIKWTLCSYHKNRRYVSGQQRALAAFIDVKEPQVEWVDVSRSGGYVKMGIQPQFVTVRITVFWGQKDRVIAMARDLFRLAMKESACGYGG
jgi:predicted CoA-binding protein